MARTEITGAQIKDSTVDLAVDVTGTLPVGRGGTGSTTLALNNVLLGNGTGGLQAVAPGTAGNVLTSNGSTWTSGVGVSRTISTATSAVTLGAVAGNQYVAYIGSGGSVALPTAVGNTSWYTIKNNDTTAKTIGTHSGDDPNWASVTALLRCNGDDGSTIFTDSSLKYTWTGATGVRLNTTIKKYGTSAVSFGSGGNNAALVSSSFPGMGTSDFTIEMWFYSTVASVEYFLYDTRPYATNGAYTTLHVTSGNKLAFYVSAADRITGTTNVTANTWHHAAVSRSGGVTRLFLNGVQEGANYTDTNSYLTGAGGYLGNTTAVIYGVWQGYLDDIRITQGVSRYTANFTAPTELTAPQLIDGAYPLVLSPNQAVELTSSGTGWSTVSDAAPTPTFATTLTSAGTTTLTAASRQVQEFTGTTTQTVRLPSAGIIAGQQFTIINNSTGLVTVQSSTAAQVHILAAGTESVFTALVATPTTAAHWEDSFFGTNFAAGKSLTVNNTLTLAGTDATSFTFPAASDTVVTLNAAQTLASKTLTTPVINGTPTGTGVAVAGTANTLVLRDGSGTITSSIVETTTAVGTIGATATLTLAGMVQTATLTSATPCTVTMPAVSNGSSFVLYLRQPATGTPTTATFTNVRWGTAGAPTITAVLGRMDILTFFSDGTNWYGQYAQGYQY